jgi:hypothetical protein
MLHELWRKNRTDGWESIGWILLCYRGVLTQPDPCEKIVNKPCREPEDKPDNIRVYIPLDINHNAILRRLDRIIAVYREVEYSCAMKSHFRKFGNEMSGSGNHLCNYASLLA